MTSFKLSESRPTPPLKGVGGGSFKSVQTNNKKSLTISNNFKSYGVTSPCPVNFVDPQKRIQRGNRFRAFNYINVIIAYLFLSIHFSCTNSSSLKQNSDIDTTICDSYNRHITFIQNPQRIISAAPGITEIIFALGEGNRLIGRTDFCDFPLEVKAIPSIGGLENPNIETITMMNPDLVIASTHFQKEMVEKLTQLNIPIAVLKNHESFEGAYELIQTVGGILHAKLRADSVINKMKKEVAEVEQLVNLIKTKPSVYFAIGFGKTGDFTAGGNTFINQLITLAGGANIASDLTGWSYSLEKLIQKDPDIILIRTGDKEIFKKTAGYTTLKAVKTDRIYEIDNNLFEITGPRLGEGLKQLYTILHSKS